MMKKILKSFGTGVSLLSIGSMASAGSLAEGMTDPVVEDLVIEEEAGSSIGILPIVALLVVAAVVVSSRGGGSDDDDSDDAEPPTKTVE